MSYICEELGIQQQFVMVIAFMPWALRVSLSYFGNQQAAGSSVNDCRGLILDPPSEILVSY